MGITDISLSRSVWSYSRVQALVSTLRRNRRWQLARPAMSGKQYLNVGCGPNIHDRFINIEYQWLPGIDLCWDLRKGLPFAEGTALGIYTEHCLEHFSLPAVRLIIGEFFRVARSGCTVRVVVPDAALYLETYRRQCDGDSQARFPFQDAVRDATQLTSPMMNVNAIFYTDRDSPAGHRCMFDYGLLAELFESAGFRDVARCGFRQGSDPTLLIDTPSRAAESLYMEAIKP